MTALCTCASSEAHRHVYELSVEYARSRRETSFMRQWLALSRLVRATEVYERILRRGEGEAWER